MFVGGSSSILQRNVLKKLVSITLSTLIIGCGSGSSPSVGTVTKGASAPIRLSIGDAPVDKVLAFEITINSIVLSPASGPNVSVLTSPTEIELTHLAGTVEPLVLSNLPQGTYTQAIITVVSPQVTYIDPSTGLIVEKNASLTSNTATINFNPALIVGANEQSLNFDFNLAGSLAFDSSNNVTVTPTFSASSQVVPQSGQEAEDGDIESMSGVVTVVNGSAFTIAPEEVAQQLSFATDSNTTFEGVTGVSSLAKGQIVEVDAVTQSDGSLLAKRVEIEEQNTNGLEVEGLVTAVTGNPATLFSLVVRDEESAGSKPGLGNSMNVTVSPNTVFETNSHQVNLNGLPFIPTFDATTLAKGQNVEVDSDSAGNSSVTASKVKLEQQSLSGSVSGFTSSGNQSNFTMTVASDSSFALLTGKTVVQVFQQSNTVLKGISSVNNGDNVRARGLVFFDGTSYKLVASRLLKP